VSSATRWASWRRRRRPQLAHRAAGTILHREARRPAAPPARAAAVRGGGVVRRRTIPSAFSIGSAPRRVDFFLVLLAGALGEFVDLCSRDRFGSGVEALFSLAVFFFAFGLFLWLPASRRFSSRHPSKLVDSLGVLAGSRPCRRPPAAARPPRPSIFTVVLAGVLLWLTPVPDSGGHRARTTRGPRSTRAGRSLRRSHAFAPLLLLYDVAGWSEIDRARGPATPPAPPQRAGRARRRRARRGTRAAPARQAWPQLRQLSADRRRPRRRSFAPGRVRAEGTVGEAHRRGSARRRPVT